MFLTFEAGHASATIAMKISRSNTEPINRDNLMCHRFRFTNIKMLMIKEDFCKNPWTTDNISRDPKQL